jgi:hypothetical protein
MWFSLNSLGCFAVSLSLLAISPNAIPAGSGYHAIPAGSGYLGCYVDSATDRIMSVYNNDPSMTNDFCAYECRGYNYFGTEFGLSTP